MQESSEIPKTTELPSSNGFEQLLKWLIFQNFKFVDTRHVLDFRIPLFVFLISLSKCKTVSYPYYEHEIFPLKTYLLLSTQPNVLRETTFNVSS